MRILSLFLIIFIFLIMSGPRYFKCKAEFKDTKALSAHKRHCSGRARAIKQALEKGKEVAARAGIAPTSKILQSTAVVVEHERDRLREDLNNVRFYGPHAVFQSKTTM